MSTRTTKNTNTHINNFRRQTVGKLRGRLKKQKKRQYNDNAPYVG